LVAGLAYVGVYTLAGVIAAEDYPGTLLRFWIGDATGLLVVTPLLLTWTDWRERFQAPGREVWLQAGSVLLALWLIFGVPFTDEFKFFYLLYLPVVWVATRHGLPGTTLVLAAIQAGLIAALLIGGDNDTTAMEFQMLMLGLSVTGLFLGGTVAVRQVAEERLHRREAELNQAMRLAAAGEMAQAVAHELNQPLSALANYSRAGKAMLDSPEHAPLLAQTLEKVEREATRAGEVVRRLREFFQGGGLRLAAIGIVDLIEEGLSPARRRAERQGVEIRLAIEADIPRLWVDRVQIGMVLHNLVANALDVLRAADPAARWVEVSARLDGAGRVRLCVSDGGPGIAPEMRDRLFESFATSKPEGMGLGLSISRTLVEAHGGVLRLDSERPTRFCFTLSVDAQHTNPA
jgi:two-component system, LuxR family, sensor kinase FixL